MILGYVRVEDNAVVTHRDSYLLETLTVVSVRRPFLTPGAAFGFAFFGFAAMFMELLWAHEIVLTLTASMAAPMIAAQVGQLKLLSRDLRGSELAGVVWGRHADLNRVRAGIVRAMAARRNVPASREAVS
ncbi:MAG: hypothetical protein WDZ83_14335 [Rhizobiaceae bacterium]